MTVNTRRSAGRGQRKMRKRKMADFWNIVVPVWGDRYINVFRNQTLPALCDALEVLGRPYQIQIYTDKPFDVGREGLELKFKDLPGPDQAFESLSNAHRHGLRRADVGSAVVLLTADLVISANSLAFCRDRFDQGKMMVCCAGMRVVEGTPENTRSGRALLEWGWKNRHPMTRDCTWPEGRSYDLWRMYFEDGDNVICRLCLPHPIALVKDGRGITFRPTIDVNVAAHFNTGETVLVTNPDDLAMIELSPPDKEYLLTEPFKKRYEEQLPSIPSFGGQLPNDRWRHFVNHAIRICGDGPVSTDAAVLRRMMHGQ